MLVEISKVQNYLSVKAGNSAWKWIGFNSFKNDSINVRDDTVV